MYKKENSSSYSIKEISVAINNCLSAALNPASGPILEARLRKLREYAAALVAPLEDHMNGGVDEIEGPFGPCLTPEEVVTILLSAALYVHLTCVAKTDKVPQDFRTALFDKEVNA